MQKNIEDVINEEILYQKAKWSDEKFDNHNPLEWLIIIEHLVNQAKTSWYNNGDVGVIDSFRKIAATSISAMEVHGAKPRIEK